MRFAARPPPLLCKQPAGCPRAMPAWNLPQPLMRLPLLVGPASTALAGAALASRGRLQLLAQAALWHAALAGAAVAAASSRRLRRRCLGLFGKDAGSGRIAALRWLLLAPYHCGVWAAIHMYRWTSREEPWSKARVNGWVAGRRASCVARAPHTHTHTHTYTTTPPPAAALAQVFDRLHLGAYPLAQADLPSPRAAVLDVSNELHRYRGGHTSACPSPRPLTVPCPIPPRRVEPPAYKALLVSPLPGCGGGAPLDWAGLGCRSQTSPAPLFLHTHLPPEAWETWGLDDSGFDTAVDWAQEQQALGRDVLVHCTHGGAQGRAGQPAAGQRALLPKQLNLQHKTTGMQLLYLQLNLSTAPSQNITLLFAGHGRSAWWRLRCCWPWAGRGTWVARWPPCGGRGRGPAPTAGRWSSCGAGRRSESRGGAAPQRVGATKRQLNPRECCRLSAGLTWRRAARACACAAHVHG